MKKQTKDTIIESAGTLFNQKGYDAVSMRDVAAQVGISVGNLTYHYPKKEDLILALVQTQHQSFVAVASPADLQALNMFFHRLVSHQKKNDFYFRHYAQLSAQYPSVYQAQAQVMQQMYDLLFQAFFNLQQEGLIRPEEVADQYNGLIHSLMSLCIFGIVHFNDSDNLGFDVMTSIWCVIYSILTDRGKTVYRDEIVILM